MHDLSAELAGTMGEAEWDWLMPHADRDALLLVSSKLDLLDVGVAIASDNVASVQSWIEQKLIGKPSPEQIKVWNSVPNKRFNALILQPYVLVQDI
ncbi:DUF2288 domain-containing protein [Leptolyngbya sp. AN02str]|uniref:DUF2288 domain-containing protein n=1 Tax=Leptolyngbya sp. AN02str TaxID=3423363 RepID=UPI003D321612